MASYKKFEELLREKGVSAADVCKAKNIEPSCLSNWKNKKSCPSVKNLYAIADYFNVPMEFFMKEE